MSWLRNKGQPTQMLTMVRDTLIQGGDVFVQVQFAFWFEPSFYDNPSFNQLPVLATPRKSCLTFMSFWAAPSPVSDAPAPAPVSQCSGMLVGRMRSAS